MRRGRGISTISANLRVETFPLSFVLLEHGARERRGLGSFALVIPQGMGRSGKGNWGNEAAAGDQDSGNTAAFVLVACGSWVFASRDSGSSERIWLGVDLRRRASEAPAAVGRLAALAMHTVGFGDWRADAATERPGIRPNRRWNNH